LIRNRTGRKIGVLPEIEGDYFRWLPSWGAAVLRPYQCLRAIYAVIALWFGHESIESSEVYLHASMAMKEKALAKATSSKTRNGRYRPTDRLRHSKFVGLREDKNPRSVVKERASES
jgi:hypothetical protein